MKQLKLSNVYSIRGFFTPVKQSVNDITGDGFLGEKHYRVLKT